MADINIPTPWQEDAVWQVIDYLENLKRPRKPEWRAFISTGWLDGYKERLWKTDELKPLTPRLQQIRNQCGPAWLQAFQPHEVLRPEAIHVALSVHNWGKGFDVESARHQLQRTGVRLTDPHVVYKLPVGSYGVYVNAMGSVCWRHPCPQAAGDLIEVYRRDTKPKKAP